MKEETKAIIKQFVTNKEARAAIIKQMTTEEAKAAMKQKLTSDETKAAVKKTLTKKYKGSLSDQWTDFKYWGKIWHACINTSKPDKKKMDAGMARYPWMYDLTKTAALGKRYGEGRTGQALKITLKSLLIETNAVIEQLQSIILDPDNTVNAQVMIPAQIYNAMDLKFFTCELPANNMIMMDQHCQEPYLDNVVNHGLPDDTCTYASQVPGVALAGHLPFSNTAIVCSNLPCEAGASSYALLERLSGLPTYRMDVPYNFKEEGARETYVKDLHGLIAFLEETTGHKMDWEKLKRECEMYNEMVDIELERWEMNRSEYPPFCNDVLWFPHLCFFQLNTGRDDAFALYKDIQKWGRKAYYLKQCSVKNLKYRAILWNPPTFGYSNFWQWLERCWGIGILNDMETFGTLKHIDTSSQDTILAGLGEQWCNAAMSRHTRGPAENWMNDLAKLNEMYHPDFILNLNHMGCRSSLGLTGAFKEWCNEIGVPNCEVDYNMYDSRVVSRQGIRDQINSFMINILHAEPLDSSLLVFDDDNEW